MSDCEDNHSDRSSEFSQSNASSLNDYEDDDEQDCIKASIETARFRSVLQCFNEIAKFTFFHFTKDGMTMFPQNVVERETKKTKKKAEVEGKSFNEPRVVCHLDNESILYNYNISEESVFVYFTTKEIIQEIKHYGKKESLVMRIDENDPTTLSFTTGQMSTTLSNLTTISGRSAVDSIYELPNLDELSKPTMSHICNEGEYKLILGGISTGTIRTIINCSCKVKKNGYVIESRAGSGSQTYVLGRAQPKEKTLKEFQWSRSTITSLKKLQSCDGICSFIFREDDTLTIERKIPNIGTITFIF